MKQVESMASPSKWPVNAERSCSKLTHRSHEMLGSQLFKRGRASKVYGDVAYTSTYVVSCALRALATFRFSSRRFVTFERQYSMFLHKASVTLCHGASNMLLHGSPVCRECSVLSLARRRPRRLVCERPFVCFLTHHFTAVASAQC